MHPWPPPQVLAESSNLLQNLILYCDALPELLHSLSNQDLDGLTKDILRRTKATLCLIG
jgi:hypothetical protein